MLNPPTRKNSCCLLWLFAAGVALLPVSKVWSAEPNDSDQPPNVLFIAADDLRNDLGCYGDRLARTPHIDHLARQGVVFERAYCQQALCNPSRTSLLTGRRPDTLRIWDLPTHFRQLPPDAATPEIVTLPEWFKRHGYFTQNVGKVFHNWRQEIHGDPQSWSVPAVLHFANHSSDTPQIGDRALPPNQATAPRCERMDVPDAAYFDGRVADLAVAALDECSRRDQPFFLAVGFWKPHLPFNAPAQYWDEYDAENVELPPNPAPPDDVPAVALHHYTVGDETELSDADVRQLRHGYLAATSYMDAQIGKLLDRIEQLGLGDRTIVVFWSDHGFHLGEHGLWGKTSNFELDARVPMIIKLPGGANAGERCDGLVELLDLYPTIVELAGLPQPAGLEGTSLRPLLDDPSQSVKPAAYTQHPRPAYYDDRPEVMGVSVRTDGVRYTEWRDFSSGEVRARELYDHRRDPGETRNVVDAPPDTAALAEAKMLLDTTFPPGGYVATPD
ncbi:MAG: sulfatase [Planctomycetales bacterium]|nr:sulfatase [Planctomycetales bacterium]